LRNSFRYFLAVISITCGVAVLGFIPSTGASVLTSGSSGHPNQEQNCGSHLSVRIVSSSGGYTDVRYTLVDMTAFMPFNTYGSAYVSGNGASAGPYTVSANNGANFTNTWHSNKPISGGVTVTNQANTLVYCYENYTIG
jgi:hypothetical protein